ncbi:thiamine phosphate synthase [bacterium]|nr:thiamine phosphate synthase [bacterium]
MNEKLCDIDYYLVTDSRLSRRGTLGDVREALRAGCRIVQYREKDSDTKTVVEEAAAIGELCRGRAVFIVNDRIDVALAVGADGVHIGQEDMPFGIARRLLGPDRIIGLTVHDVAESMEAERLGADYVGLSPIFETGTKKDAGKACGVAMIRAVKERVAIPVVAIGGINKANIAGVIGAGADAACAISAVLCADDVFAETAAFREIIRNNRP